MQKKMIFAATAAALSLVLAACGGSDGATKDSAEDFPANDIKMVVSYAAGGPTDLAGRAIAKFYAKEFGVPVVVENVEGASGAVGTAKVAKSKPDGLTIGMTTSSAAGRVPLIQNVGYQLSDLAAIGVGTVGPGLIVVRADSPYKTADEFFAAAKAKPGTIKFGTAGASAPQHVELQRMDREYGIKFRLVPFQGEAPEVTALLGNNIDAGFASNAAVTLAQVDAGKLRVLATASDERLEYLPEAKTLKELGFDKLTYGTSYFILVAPAGTPKKILAKLESGLKKALDDPETRKVIGPERISPTFIGSSGLMDMMMDEQVVLKPILKELFAN